MIGFVIFLLLTTPSFSLIKTKVINTPILSFIPELKLHPIVTLTDCKFSPRELYIVDFNPVPVTENSERSKIVNLLMGKNLPGEIRIRKIKDGNLLSEDKIVEVWNKMNEISAEESNTLNEITFNKIKSKEIKRLVEKSREWTPVANLYSRNCRHFCQFFLKIK